jgi:hypothetical protein
MGRVTLASPVPRCPQPPAGARSSSGPRGRCGREGGSARRRPDHPRVRSGVGSGRRALWVRVAVHEEVLAALGGASAITCALSASGKTFRAIAPALPMERHGHPHRSTGPSTQSRLGNSRTGRGCTLMAKRSVRAFSSGSSRWPTLVPFYARSEWSGANKTCPSCGGFKPGEPKPSAVHKLGHDSECRSRTCSRHSRLRVRRRLRKRETDKGEVTPMSKRESAPPAAG